jgi:hypothetical protein
MKPNEAKEPGKVKKKRTPKDGPQVKGGSADSRQVAALVLEVLAGATRPSDAARALHVTLPRYYQMERRALEGLVRGCEPAPKGPRTDPQKEMRKLERKVKRLENECLRYQSLARAAGRSLGLKAIREEKSGKRRRKPAVRALKVARGLKSEPPAPAEPDAAKGVKCEA